MLQSDPSSTTATIVVITTQEEEPRYANLLHSVQCMAIRYTRRKGVQLQQQQHLVLGLVAIGDRAAALRWRRRRTRLLPLHKLQRLGDDPLTCIAMTSDANPTQSNHFGTRTPSHTCCTYQHQSIPARQPANQDAVLALAPSGSGCRCNEWVRASGRCSTTSNILDTSRSSQTSSSRAQHRSIKQDIEQAIPSSIQRTMSIDAELGWNTRNERIVHAETP